MRNGSERVVTSTREHLHDLRQLESYVCHDEYGRDQGMNGTYVKMMDYIRTRGAADPEFCYPAGSGSMPDPNMSDAAGSGSEPDPNLTGSGSSQIQTSTTTDNGRKIPLSAPLLEKLE